jgi:Adenylate and Guanylate cyclase catalytic domain
MVTERVLPTATSIQNCLLSEYDVDSRIGATMGNAYCGVVGGILRHEYAVLGPSVNLAARLMASSANPGVLVDDAIRRLADRSHGFKALTPVNAKGYSKPVAIFEPISSLRMRWDRMTPNFVGRNDDLEALTTLGFQIAASPKRTPAKLVLVSGVRKESAFSFRSMPLGTSRRGLRSVHSRRY